MATRSGKGRFTRLGRAAAIAGSATALAMVVWAAPAGAQTTVRQAHAGPRPAGIIWGDHAGPAGVVWGNHLRPNGIIWGDHAGPAGVVWGNHLRPNGIIWGD